LIDNARDRLARLFGVRPTDIVFTSGATEAANTALTPLAPRHPSTKPLAKLLVGATEHVAVLQGHRFDPSAVQRIPVDRTGLVDAAALEARVAGLTADYGPASVMVALQAANNETGVLQSTADVARRLKPTGAVLVCDAAQIAGKLPLDMAASGADATIL